MPNPVGIEEKATTSLMHVFPLVVVLFFCICGVNSFGIEVGKLSNHFKNAKVATLIASSFLAQGLFVIPCLAAENSGGGEISFPMFLKDLDDGKVDKVVFKGIRPEYLTSYYKTGDIVLVKEGFPAYDDPLGPSGPIQAIARVQHAPGVVVLQDITDVLKLTKRGAGSGEMKPMLKHSSYPKEYAYKQN